MARGRGCVLGACAVAPCERRRYVRPPGRQAGEEMRASQMAASPRRATIVGAVLRGTHHRKGLGRHPAPPGAAQHGRAQRVRPSCIARNGEWGNTHTRQQPTWPQQANASLHNPRATDRCARMVARSPERRRTWTTRGASWGPPRPRTWRATHVTLRGPRRRPRSSTGYSGLRQPTRTAGCMPNHGPRRPARGRSQGARLR